jgi:pimeloyl-ACP methyl ester carboxylesterase
VTADLALPDGWTTGGVAANGVDLRYYRAAGAGDDPPVVLAHGMYEHGRRWCPLADDLPEWDLIAYDARGHGRSAAPESGYGIDDRVADLVGLCDALDLADPVLVGHSMGAATAAWAAATNPDRVRGLVLEDPSRFHQEPDFGEAEAREAAGEYLAEQRALSVDERAAALADEAPDASPEHRRRLARAIGECGDHVVEYAQAHDLVVEAFDEIACPTLVLRRDRDVEGRVADLDAADRLGDGRLVHVPGADHDVLFTAYDAAVAELEAFLRRLQDRGGF